MDDCELCGRETEHAVVDHCHPCGTIRGRVCRRCNRDIDTAIPVLEIRRSRGYVLPGSWDDKACQYLDRSHWPGELSCLRAGIAGTSYRAWCSAGRPLPDWWNVYRYRCG